MNEKVSFTRFTSSAVLNLVGVMILFSILISPIIVSTGFLRFSNLKNLVLGTTDVLDYGNLVKTEKLENGVQLIKVDYFAFPKTPTIYENIAYVKNEASSTQSLRILSSFENAELFFNIPGNSKPKKATLDAGQVIYLSLIVGPADDNSEEQRRAEFAVISF